MRFLADITWFVHKKATKIKEDESPYYTLLNPPMFSAPITPLQTAVKIEEVVKLKALVAEEEEDIAGIASGLGNLTDTKSVSKTPGLVEPAKTVSFYDPKKIEQELEEDILASSNILKTPSIPASPTSKSTSFTFPPLNPPFTAPIVPFPLATLAPPPLSPPAPAPAPAPVPATNDALKLEEEPMQDTLAPTDLQTANIVPKDKNAPRYHQDAILLFFGSETVPEWDLELVESVNKLNWNKKQIRDAIDAIIDRHAENYLILTRKSDGDIQEFLEVIQIHFCFHRQLQRGNRTRTANVPISSIVAFSNRLNGVSSSAPSDPATLPDYVPSSRTDAALASVVNIPENQATAKIIEAFDARNTDYYGRPLANEAVIAMTLVRPDGNLIGLADPKDPVGSVPKPLSYLNIKTRKKDPCRKY